MEFSNNSVPTQQLNQQQQQPVPAPGQQQQSQMDRLRQQMAQQQAQQRVQPTVMQQGNNYAPTQQMSQQSQQYAQQPQQAQQTQQQQNQQNQQNQQVQQNVSNDSDDSDDKKKGGISPKFLLIGVGVFIIVIILMFVFSGLNSADKPQETTNPGMDEFGNPIDPETGLPIQYIEPEVPEFPGYSFDETEALRAAGYTGYEIEQFEAEARDYNELIAEAEAARQAWIDEAVAPLYDTASDEYKNSVRNTWLGLPERTDVEDFTETGSYYEETKNLDYEKVEPRGQQLFVKVYLDDSSHETYFFVNVEPSDYLKLNDSGNVVVTYKYTVPVVFNEELQVFEEHEDQRFIVDASLTIY